MPYDASQRLGDAVWRFEYGVDRVLVRTHLRLDPDTDSSAFGFVVSNGGRLTIADNRSGRIILDGGAGFQVMPDTEGENAGYLTKANALCACSMQLFIMNNFYKIVVDDLAEDII